MTASYACYTRERRLWLRPLPSSLFGHLLLYVAGGSSTLSFLFFLDESGQDHRESPYEVRSAVAVHDSRLWDLVAALRDAELDVFGTSYAEPGRELKAKRLLNRPTFRLATQMDPIDPGRDRCRRIVPQPFFVHSEKGLESHERPFIQSQELAVHQR